MMLPDGVRGGWGGLELVAPGAAARLCGLRLDQRAGRVARVLGARQLVQALVTVAVPTTAVRRLGVGVDALHAVSMIALAGVDSRRRRTAVTEAVIAVTFAATGVLAARRSAQPGRSVAGRS